MQGLTPEQIQEGRGLLETRNESFDRLNAFHRWLISHGIALLGIAERERDRHEVAGVCGGCGGKHGFDTSVPSPLWNAVIRRAGLSDYLCAACILKAFAQAETSFSAVLYGDDLAGIPIVVEVNGEAAHGAMELVEQNNSLRAQLTAIGKALRAYPDSDLASLAETVATRNEALEAQLTAREQENAQWKAAFASACEIAEREHFDGCDTCASTQCEDSKQLTAELAALAPSQPPQTTAENTGWQR